MVANNTVSPATARKWVLQSQCLPARKGQSQPLSLDKPSPPDHTLALIEHLSYVQIDTLAVVARAHHHTLWARQPSYKPEYLEQLMAQRDIFEYWSHAASYLPMKDYRFSLPRMQAIASGEMDHWYKRDNKMMRHVIKRITEEGPLRARDFEGKLARNAKEWTPKPAKQALSYLFMQGDLMCTRREGFQMVYDLRERVLPSHINIQMPTPETLQQHLIKQFLKANALAKAPHISYLRRGQNTPVKQQLENMLEAGELVSVSVAEHQYLCLPELLDKKVSRIPPTVTILSPFDNLLIQRQRMLELFQFNYQIECYVNVAKRRYGYFCLPILWGDKLVARMDCKAHRKTSTLELLSLHLEPTLRTLDTFSDALAKALSAFASMNNCNSINLSLLKKSAIHSTLANALQTHHKLALQL